MKLKLLLASMMTLTLAASSRAQWEWIETGYSEPILIPFYNFKLGPEWSASETREYEWFAAFRCHFTVVGDEPTPDPNWRLLFAGICNNWWWDSAVFVATIPATYIVTNKAEYYVRTGSNAFVHFHTEETVGRTLDEKVSTRIYWEAGPPPSGGAGQGS